MESIHILQQTPLFQILSKDSIRQYLLPHGIMRTYPQQSTIIHAQDTVDHIHVILSGQVQLLHIMDNGLQNLFAKLGPSAIFGFDLICTQTKSSPYYAITTADTKICVLPASIFLEQGTLPEHERLHVLQQLLTLLSHQNMKKEYHLAILSHNRLRDRIMVYLNMQATKRHSNQFTIPFNRDEMAMFLCVNRSALSHELSRMKQEGLIDFHKNNFTLY